MIKKLSYLFLMALVSSCCTSTNTYESFTEEQKQLLYYLNGQQIVYDINNKDSLNLYVSERYIGNLPPDELEESNCDSYYPAYGKAVVKSQLDTSINFTISIKKGNNELGVSTRIKWMGYDFNLSDTERVEFYDSLYLKSPSNFKNVYEINVLDTTNTRPDLIHRVYFSTDYGVIRFDRKDGRVYRLRGK